MHNHIHMYSQLHMSLNIVYLCDLLFSAISCLSVKLRRLINLHNLPSLKEGLEIGQPFTKVGTLHWLSPLEMYSRFVLAITLCSAKMVENGQWLTIMSSSVI